MTISEYFTSRKYPGRVIIAGSTASGKSVLCYAIMGRSENSRNRVFAFDDEGKLQTRVFDESKVSDPSLIIYNAMRQTGNSIILTNGSQTDLIYDELESGRSFEDAVIKMSYEPDEPNWTSRISALFDEKTSSYQLAVVRKEGDATGRVIYKYPQQKGYGHCIHTYLESDDDSLLPPFTKDPERLNLPDSLAELTSQLWNSLDQENKISLFVQVGDEMTILNKNNGD